MRVFHAEIFLHIASGPPLTLLDGASPRAHPALSRYAFATTAGIPNDPLHGPFGI